MNLIIMKNQLNERREKEKNCIIFFKMIIMEVIPFIIIINNTNIIAFFLSFEIIIKKERRKTKYLPSSFSLSQKRKGLRRRKWRRKGKKMKCLLRKW